MVMVYNYYKNGYYKKIILLYRRGKKCREEIVFSTFPNVKFHI